MLYGILLVLLSSLAVPSIVLSHKPEAKKVFEKIEPFIAWAGLLFIIIGSIELIDSIIKIPVLFIKPIWWLSLLAVGTFTTVLAFLLGYPLIKQYFLKNSNPQSQQQAQEIHDKTYKYQSALGVIGTVLGLWMIIIDSIAFIP